ncbi:MAG: serine hydrolase [Oscillospiraceae bacterium]|nr:D-alanyl-D-alanine carboxypeptidase [Oscillospiraceae bacterium]MCM0705618.1 serine hydrolase [Faecalicatena sp. BF-R-105]MDY3217936.1 serine hydrolase [Candidatus Fimivivens sp.]SFI59396.1 D-alanyl-D-alanine carboxypeptidase (penicillin-binding protein 5/6) [Ruminococcaceae bacterium D5]GKH49501.1 serine-type D-Ala-D-Ala carboxypeptidase [Eubacteriales bacterium]
MKKFFLFLFVLVFCTSTIGGSCLAAAYTPNFDLAAESVYLINLDSDMVICEQNADKPIEPSSLAQLMTVVLALEKVENPENAMATMRGYIQDEMYRQNVSLGGIRLAGLYKDEEISIQKLMYAVMIRDANEAAMMIADYVGDGSVPYFVEMMNERAQELGMSGTKFTSPHGLPDPESHTTARDMALLARHALSLPGFEALMTATTYDGGPTNINEHLNWNTTNRLMVSSSPYYNSAVSGIKTGYHHTLGSYAVTLARRNGYSYLAVLMASRGADTQSDNDAFSAFDETNRLYNWAFSTFRVKTLLEKGKSFGEVPLRLAWGKDFLRIMSADNFTALIPDAIEASSIQYELVLPEYVQAPVEKGQLIGEVRLVLAGEKVGVVGVVSAEQAEASRALLLLDRVIGLTRTYWFKFIVIFLAVLMILYIALMIVRNRNRRRYGRRRR